MVLLRAARGLAELSRVLLEVAGGLAEPRSVLLKIGKEKKSAFSFLFPFPL